MQYHNKYLKYKNKYLELKKQIGGEVKISCDKLSNLGLNNRYGTCWNIVLLTILYFSDEFKDEIQEKLLNDNDYIESSIENLKIFGSIIDHN